MRLILKNLEIIDKINNIIYLVNLLHVFIILYKLEIIKTMSNKFGLDVVFVLDISFQKLSNIDCLSECIHLV